MIEGGQIFGGAATAGNNDDIDGARFVEVTDAGADFERRRFSLDLRGIDKDAGAMVTAAQATAPIERRGIRPGLVGRRPAPTTTSDGFATVSNPGCGQPLVPMSQMSSA